MVTSAHHKYRFVAVREKYLQHQKVYGKSLPCRHGKRRRGWVCSGLRKAWGIVVGTGEVGKYVCLKMKNPFFITANICLWLRANRCLCSLKWCCLVVEAEMLFSSSSILQQRTSQGCFPLGRLWALSRRGCDWRKIEIKIKHLHDWEKANQW